MAHLPGGLKDFVVGNIAHKSALGGLIRNAAGVPVDKGLDEGAGAGYGPPALALFKEARRDLFTEETL